MLALYACSMTVRTLIFMPFLNLRLNKKFFFFFFYFSYAPGFNSIIFNQSSKFYILATKTDDHQLANMVLHVVSIHVSRLLCCYHSWHISKRLSIIRQKVAIPVQLAGKLDN